MKTGEVARLLGVSHTTISDWIERFEEFFSAGAKEKRRLLTENDILTLATIAKLSHDGFKLSAISERLAGGERVDHPGVANFGIDSRVIPAAAVEQMIDASALRTELEIVKAERERLLETLDRQQNRIDELTRRIEDLSRELGRDYAKGFTDGFREAQKGPSNQNLPD